MTRGRGKATLPPADYRRRSTVDASGLICTPLGPAGQDLGTYNFTQCPGSLEIRRELAAGFARAARAWTSAASCDTHAKVVRQFLRHLEKEYGKTIGHVGEISAGIWNRWVDAIETRRMLGAVLRQVPSLPAATLAAMSVRSRWVRKAAPKESFSRTELLMIRDEAARTVRTARLRITSNARLLERWRSGEMTDGDKDWPWGELLDILSRDGDFPRTPSGYPPHPVRRELARRFVPPGRYHQGISALFPTVVEKGAAAVLLICHEAWNLSVLAAMEVPSVWPNGDGDTAEPVVQRVETDKARRGSRLRHSTNNLVNVGEDTAGWALRQVVDMTEQVRITLAGLGRPSRALLWSRGLHRGEMFNDGSTGLEHAIVDWCELMGARGVALPPGIGARKLRHSVEVVIGAPHNNTRKVHDDAYVRRDRRVIEDSPTAVAAGLTKAVEQARAHVRMRVVTVDGGDPECQAHAVQGQVGITLEAARQFVSGDLDTAVGACQDFDHSPFSTDGPCSVSFLLCFACPNALATGRHLPRIVYLFKALEALRSAVAPAVWMADWKEHHARVGDLLAEHTVERAWPALLGRLTGSDRELIDAMLERKLDP
ncbi:hypothetical protein [Streptomyces sp. NBC_01207]|nr:hypothetical protein [Streptomyces sp. NBC_01207]WSR18746.1 hypothetical protein OG457_39035 [Streptomyces sp. NBC_01207]